MKPVFYFPNLTPLRGIAALLTVVFHVGLMVAPLVSHSNLLNRMYLMVDFFFVLSGFIMCHVYGKLFSTGISAAAFKKFAIARFARVYPLHFITLLYTIVLFFIAAKLGMPKEPVIEIENSWFSIITNLLLLHSMNFHNWFSWVHASWSISTEWWAYMIFPFLVQPFSKLTTYGKTAITFLCFAGYLCIIFFIIPLVTIPKEISFVKINPADLSINVAYQFGFIRCLCGFVLGMMMYQGFENNWGKKILANGYTMGITVLALFTSMHFGLPDVISVSFLPFLLLSAAYGSKSINRLFATNALQRLGDWSFSIYLVHQPLIFTIFGLMAYFNPADPKKPQPAPSMLITWCICLVFIVITLLVSSFMYRFWELPARRWINKKAA